MAAVMSSQEEIQTLSHGNPSMAELMAALMSSQEEIETLSHGSSMADYDDLPDLVEADTDIQTLSTPDADGWYRIHSRLDLRGDRKWYCHECGLEWQTVQMSGS